MNTEALPPVSSKLKAIRTTLDHSLQWMADKTGLAKGTYRYYEEGDNGPYLPIDKYHLIRDAILESPRASTITAAEIEALIAPEQRTNGKSDEDIAAALHRIETMLMELRDYIEERPSGTLGRRTGT